MNRLSPLELNKSIAMALYPDAEVTHFNSKKPSVFIKNPNHSDLPWVQVKDYYNNWNDLMPLVVERGIHLIYQSGTGKWKAFTYYSDGEFYEDYEIFNENPQHALAECLLKVLTEGKAK